MSTPRGGSRRPKAGRPSSGEDDAREAEKRWARLHSDFAFYMRRAELDASKRTPGKKAGRRSDA